MIPLSLTISLVVTALSCVVSPTFSVIHEGQGGGQSPASGKKEETKPLPSLDTAYDRVKDYKKSLPQRPNIVLIFADDLGFADLGFSGHPNSRTPTIDQLASNGRFFTNFYVSSPICSPSRASLLTGRQQVRSGVYPGTFTPDSTLGLPRNETTIAQLLSDKGYNTMIVGKWHLGVGVSKEYLPTHFGFDGYYGIPYSHDMCPCRTCFPEDGPCYDLCWQQDVSCPLFNNTDIIEQPADLTTLTERYVNRALSFIDNAVVHKTPFFLYLPFHQVHHPQFASKKFHNKSLRGRIGDALLELDWAVQEIVTHLQNLGLLSSTLIWFSSDNGPSLTRHERGGCAGMLRCGKGTTWEGGVRVPTFVHWPDYIKPGRTSALASTFDVLPTITKMTGIDTSHLTLDGIDISSLLWDPQATSPREFFPIYPETPERSLGPFAVRNNRYKAHFYTKGSDLSDASNYDPMCPGSHQLTHHDPPLLFDMQVDPGERYDLGKDPDYKNVIDLLVAWRKGHMANMTWMDAQTQTIDERSQPCCTDNKCDPFPGCCDCPAKYHLNHIFSYKF